MGPASDRWVASPPDSLGHAHAKALGRYCRVHNTQNLNLPWLAGTIGQQACRPRLSVFQVRVAPLFGTRKITHGDGRFTRWLAPLAKIHVRSLDDRGLQDRCQAARNDLLKGLDDRAGSRLIVVTRQFSLAYGHTCRQDLTRAHAMLEQLVLQALKLPFKSDSMRKKSETGFGQRPLVIPLRHHPLGAPHPFPQVITIAEFADTAAPQTCRRLRLTRKWGELLPPAHASAHTAIR